VHPILFELSGLPIHAYGVLGALAFVVGTGITLLRARALGFEVHKVADLIFWLALASLAGARLLYVAQHPADVRSLWSVFDLRGGGLVFYGAFLTGIPAGFVLLRRYGFPVFVFWDILATALPFAHAVSRVGCFLAGCCYGTPSDAAWAVTFPAGTPTAPPGVPLHPVQLYEAATLLVIGVATNLFYPHRRFDGQVILLYLLAYAGARTVLESFRGDPGRGLFLPGLLGGAVSFSQGMSAIVAVVAVVVFFVGARRLKGA
jgi:phosphatidylglycerol:prolipoprotein diacylglycerol transferase